MDFLPNPEQRAVIEAAASARLVVDGGPGTGKTATAAARAIALIGKGIAPERLCLISFTRAAVEEMRRRLAALAPPGIKLPLTTTLDSFAWGLRDGEMDGDRPVVESYDAAIAETLARLQDKDAHITARLAALDHLIIDETQDLVGARALLVIAIAAAMSRASGLTILTDEAQAIYGFASRGLQASFTAETVAQHFLETDGFALHELKLLHRTGEKKLARLFHRARRQALSLGNPHTKLKRLHRTVSWHDLSLRRRDKDPELILYRSRAEVLHTATEWARDQRPYRLRLSGLPILPSRWIGLLLHDYAYATLHREAFLELWRERLAAGDSETEWASLAGDNETLSLRDLCKSLAASEPPPALCRFDPGAENAPMLGTIHASKGREADTVRLMLPLPRGHRWKNDDPDSEARVLFVGATRAKKALTIGRGLDLGARRLKSGRVYIPGKARAEIEIGRPGDFDWSPCASLIDELALIGHGTQIALRYADDKLGAYLGESLLGSASPFLLDDLRQVLGMLTSTYGAVNAIFADTCLLDTGTAVAGDKFYLAPIITGLARMTPR